MRNGIDRCARTGAGATGDAEHDPHRRTIGQHGRTPVAQERSHHARQRQDAEQAAGNHERLNHQPERDADRQERRVVSGRPDGDTNAPPAQKAVQRDHDQQADEPELFSDGREDGALVCADAWWHHQGTGMTGHVVRDLPAALGFAAVVAAVGRPSAGGALPRAPARPGDDLLRPVPVAPARTAVAALRGSDGHGFVLPWLEVAALSALVAWASWVLVERPAIEAVGRCALGRAACRASRPTGTSSRCRAWREACAGFVGLPLGACGGARRLLPAPRGRELGAARGARRRRPRACVFGVRSRVFCNTFGAHGVERRSYPVLTGEDRRSTLRPAEAWRNTRESCRISGGRPRALRPPRRLSPRCSRKRPAPPQAPRGEPARRGPGKVALVRAARAPCRARVSTSCA